MRPRQSRRAWTVRRHLNLMIAGIAVPLVILAVSVIAFVLRLERRAAEEHVLQVARGVAVTIDREVASAEAALRVLATSGSLQGRNWRALHEQALVARTSQDAWVLLFDPRGQQLVNTRFPPGTPLARRANPERVTEVLSTGRASVSDVYVGVLTQQPIVTVDVPVTVQGQRRYVLTQAYFLDHFDHLLRRYGPPAQWTVTVIDRAGITIARSPGGPRLTGRPAAADIVARARAAGEGGLVRRTREGVTAYTAFTRSDQSGWLVTVAVPTSVLNAPAAGGLLVTGLGALVALGLAAVLAAWTSRRITRPLRALAEDAAGLQASAPPAARARGAVDEILRVGRALEQAAAAIRAREVELRSSEARLAAIVHSAADAIIVVDDEHRIALFNPSAERTFRCSGRAAVGRPLAQFLPDALDGGRADAAPAAARDDAPVSAASPVQLRARRLDGEEFPIEATMARVHGENRERVILVVRDVTERVRTEHALQRQAERLRMLHDIDRAMLAARSWSDIASGALGRLRRLIGAPRAVLVGLHARDGEAEWLAVDVEGPTTLGVGVRFPLAMLGDPHALGRGEVQRFDVADRPDIPVARRLAEEGIGHYVVVPLIADGRLIGTVNFGADQGGRITDEAIEVARDVAAQLAVVLEQSRLREELARYARELEARVGERTRKLTEINEQLEGFAYSVSHDLRAPLRALEGFAQALVKHYAGVLDARGQDYARRIATAAARMDALIRDLLAHSQLARADVTLRTVDVNGVLIEVLRLLENNIQASGADVRSAPELPPVHGNEALLVQALRNLVVNALTFVPPGERPVVRIDGEVHDHTVRLTVEDNGIGIPQEYRERIFKVFERLHGVEAYPGTGIGLAIARTAVERMGGRIGVDSASTRGSCFWIELPVAQTRAQ